MNASQAKQDAAGAASAAGQSVLFDLGPAKEATPAAAGARPRLRYANREQATPRVCALDDLIPLDHQVRIVWDYVNGLDLSPLLAQIQATEAHAGAPATDPRILMTLWLYATLRAVGSARELNRRCDPQCGEVPLQWIRGEVSVNYHMLADFRTAHGALLDSVLTQSVAALRHEGLVTMERVARERRERLQRALRSLSELEANNKSKDKEPRVSTTDAEARVMKMGDGGFRPAFNAQLATDTATQIITGVEVSNSGGDQGKMAPMVHQHEERYGAAPSAMLVDGGFAKKEDIEEVSPPHGATTVYAPVRKSKDPDRDPHTPRADDAPAVAQWRQRMATAEAKAIYKERASTAECVNAIARNRGLQQFRVRGRIKVRAVLLWFVLAHNLVRAAALRAQRDCKAG